MRAFRNEPWSLRRGLTSINTWPRIQLRRKMSFRSHPFPKWNTSRSEPFFKWPTPEVTYVWDHRSRRLISRNELFSKWPIFEVTCFWRDLYVQSDAFSQWLISKWSLFPKYLFSEVNPFRKYPFFKVNFFSKRLIFGMSRFE